MSCVGKQYDVSYGSKNVFNALNTSLINACNSKIYGGKTRKSTRKNKRENKRGNKKEKKKI